MAAFPLLGTAMAADRETYRGDLSGVPEDAHGPFVFFGLS